ncbi:MAG: hypothetical protein QHJ81_13125 [Anaerolineae bacterium]|nr:hypothetical protein [Anaerolineae bacterium]
MTTLKARNVQRALLHKLGFEHRSGHHGIYRLYLDGRLVARTYMSHGQRELSDYHISQMAQQMRLSRQEFLDAVACPLDQETYHALLRQRLEVQPCSPKAP